MAFTVSDYRDLIELLRQHPEWREELRRELLTDELLELPSLVRQLGDAQDRTEQQLATLTQRVDTLAEAQVRTEQQLATLTQRVDGLAEAQARTEQQLATLTQRVDGLAEAQVRTEQQLATLTQRVDGLAEAQVRTEQQLATLTQRVDGLAEAQVRTEQQLATLTQRVDGVSQQVGGLADRFGHLEGEVLESRYERRAGSYFGRLIRRVRVVDSIALTDLLDQAIDQGRITEAERNEIIRADLVLTGQRVPDRTPAYFVVEISAGVGVGDVRRAIDRASALSKVGQVSVPVVAGRRINVEARRLAESTGVLRVIEERLPPVDDSD